MPARKAVVTSAPRPKPPPPIQLSTAEIKTRLLAALAHPNIASKHWIIRQYDHEVLGGSVIKPLIGPRQQGPSDAAVLRPKLSSRRGIAIGCGLSPQIEDPYDMALASIDEAIRNVVAVGADPDRIAILDNFCWPSVDDEITMGTLVRACEACRDAALAYRIPFISGKDSLHNQFTNTQTGEVIRIPRTLLISAIGILDDVRACVTMDFKSAGNHVAYIAADDPMNPGSLRQLHEAVAALIRTGKVAACHDVSDGGVAVAAAEMSIASGLGLAIEHPLFSSDAVFSEASGRFLLELNGGNADSIRSQFQDSATVSNLGAVQSAPMLEFGGIQIGVDLLTAAWRSTLDW